MFFVYADGEINKSVSRNARKIADGLNADIVVVYDQSGYPLSAVVKQYDGSGYGYVSTAYIKRLDVNSIK